MTKTVMDIVRSNKLANKKMEFFVKMAKDTGLIKKETEYLEARKTMLMLIIADIPEAMQVMAGEVWEEINNIKAM